MRIFLGLVLMCAFCAQADDDALLIMAEVMVADKTLATPQFRVQPGHPATMVIGAQGPMPGESNIEISVIAEVPGGDVVELSAQLTAHGNKIARHIITSFGEENTLQNEDTSLCVIVERYQATAR